MLVDDALSRIRNALGVVAPDPRFEGLVAGRADVAVTGIATCAMPSVDLVRQATATGCNLILADGHPFYAYDAVWDALPGAAEALAGSPTVAAKAAMIDQNKMAVARFPTAWTRQMPDDASQALAGSMGWRDVRPVGGFVVTRIQPTTLTRLARSLSTTAQTEAVRLVGDPTLPVRGVAVAAGLLAPATIAAMLADPGVDAIVTGEVNEWEGGPYFEDAVLAGRPAGLILLGFATSLDPLADALLRWLRPLVPRVPVIALHQRGPIAAVEGSRT